MITFIHAVDTLQKLVLTHFFSFDRFFNFEPRYKYFKSQNKTGKSNFM